VVDGPAPGFFVAERWRDGVPAERALMVGGYVFGSRWELVFSHPPFERSSAMRQGLLDSRFNSPSCCVHAIFRCHRGQHGMDADEEQVFEARNIGKYRLVRLHRTRGEWGRCGARTILVLKARRGREASSSGLTATNRCRKRFAREGGPCDHSALAPKHDSCVRLRGDG